MGYSPSAARISPFLPHSLPICHVFLHNNEEPFTWQFALVETGAPMNKIAEVTLFFWIMKI
jgi:hypothetical protein